MSFQILILFSVLCFAAHSEAKWKLQDNVSVAVTLSSYRQPNYFIVSSLFYGKNVYIIDSTWTSSSPSEKVHLCNVSGKDYWMRDNETDRHHDSWERDVKEPLDAGNFTCWNKTNGLLSYTTLYVARIGEGKLMLHSVLESEGSGKRNFKCTANNFSGNFTCSWMIAPQIQNQSLKFAVRSLNMNNISGSITCEEPIRDTTTLRKYSVSCKKERSCPAAEEYQQIEICLDVFDNNLYENYTLNFFIKDIIKPDVTACEIAEISTSSQLSWKPPQTWSTPVSYFGLTYQIKKKGTQDRIYEVDNPTQLENGNLGCSDRIRGNEVCYIRSRDRYNKNSAWSEWSQPCSRESQKNGEKRHTRDVKEYIVPCNRKRIRAENA
uniref:interleukin-12 subunit beta n=1 Tax=Euleptes europaea TaxID=460621 RepID=UPI002540CBE3|nr:interleukin-12 subunit beta [Euleptes europaea]